VCVIGAGINGLATALLASEFCHVTVVAEAFSPNTFVWGI